MSKRAPVDNERLSSFADRAADLRADLMDVADDIRRDIGWSDDVTKPLTYAREFAALAKAAADLSTVMLTKLSLEEDRAALKADLTARSAKP